MVKVKTGRTIGFLQLNLVLGVGFLLIIFACGSEEIYPHPQKPGDESIGFFVDDWTYHVNARDGDNFDIAEFQLWLPDPSNVSQLKAILVLASSYNSVGLGLVESETWQEFAIENDLALIGVHLKSLEVSNIYESYTNANDGSGRALLTALKAISDENDIADVAKLPFLLRGYSGGGMFSFSFTSFQAQRVVAFANIRGWAVSATLNENKNVPGIILIAELDHAAGNNAMKSVVRNNRNANGLWAYAVEANVGHLDGLDKSDELIRHFFSSVLQKRFSTENNDLLSLEANTGWLGNNDTKVISPFGFYTDDPANASWLIDEEFALEWQKFQVP